MAPHCLLIFYSTSSRHTTATGPNSIRKLIQGNWCSVPLSRTTKKLNLEIYSIRKFIQWGFSLRKVVLYYFVNKETQSGNLFKEIWCSTPLSKHCNLVWRRRLLSKISVHIASCQNWRGEIKQISISFVKYRSGTFHHQELRWWGN